MLKWLYGLFRKKYAVSVVIPTHKNTQFIIECVQSIIASASKCCEYEILIGIDNCKETLEFVGKHSIFKSRHIKTYYFPKNVGPYVIRNSLAEIAKYDNILFFDSDDVMMPSMLKVLLSHFDGKELLKFKFYNFENGSDYNDIQNLSISSILAQASFLIKKETFLRMNGFYGWKCGADAEFDERYTGNKNKTHILDVPLYYRRYHDRNITRLPETGINSPLRKRYETFILDNRKNGKWKNPERPYVAKFNPVNV